MKPGEGHRITRRVRALQKDVMRLREAMWAEEGRMSPIVRMLHPSHHAGARNLRHAALLRSEGGARLDTRLNELGYAVLGGGAQPILPRLDILIDAMTPPAGSPVIRSSARTKGPDHRAWEKGIAAKAAALFGKQRTTRRRYLMVTLPSEAADDPAAIRRILAAGADCVRINCARDDQAIWEKIIRHVRRAESSIGKSCRVLLDLGGPKVRTGPMPAAATALKVRPVRDGEGNIIRAARIGLVHEEHTRAVPETIDALIRVLPWGTLDVRPGMRLAFRDARGTKRRWTVMQVSEGLIIAEAGSTAYIAPGTALRLKAKRSGGRRDAKQTITVGGSAAREAGILLRVGDSLRLAGHPAEGRAAEYDDAGRLLVPATAGTSVRIPVNRIRPGQEIWFDDGKIGGIVRERNAGVLRVEITVVRGGRRMLREDRGINVPGVDLGLEGFTEKDKDNLRFALRFADMVGLSFVHTPGDVDRLLEAMKSPAGRRTGFILKIENERAVHALDDLLLAAMRHTSVGVLVARGDLAVECGFARLPEIQDDILRRSHLAGLPVIWATEVLENLSRRGVPTRPELTDARKGLDADCILLGKGPYVQDAMRLIGQLDRRRHGRPRPDQSS